MYVFETGTLPPPIASTSASTCSDFESLEEAEVEENTQLGLEVAELEFGISPVMTVEEMSSMGEPDTLCMVMYLSQFHQLFKDSMPHSGEACQYRTLLHNL